MPTIESTRQHFLYEFSDRNRMLSIRFGGRRPELRPPPRSFLVQRADIAERLSATFHAVVQGITPDVWEYPHEKVPGDRDVEPHPDRFLGLPTGVIVRAESRIRTFHGVVTGARHLGSWQNQTEDRGYHAVELTIESPLRLLDLRRANRLYLERTTRQILHELLNEHRFCNEVVEETLRVTFPDERDEISLARACRTQYQESDLDFIQRMLIDEGLNYVLRSEKGESGTGNIWDVFGADHDFGSDPHATLSTRPRPGELLLLKWHGQRRLVPAYTAAGSHDYRANAHFEGIGQGRQNEGMGQHARGQFGSYDSLPPRAVIDPKREMDLPARHRQWAHDMDAEVFEGETIAPLALVKPLRVRRLDAARVPLHAKEDHYLVVAQRIVATAAIDPELRQRLAPLADEVRLRAGIDLFVPPGQSDTPPLRVTFQAHPAGKPLVPRHPRHAKRPLPGPMTATVAGPEGKVVQTDELGRIAVIFQWEREPDVSDFAVNFPQFSSPPVRIRYIHPGAGQGVGMQCLPRVGDEVLILFIDNDPDRPIAVGSVHNGHRGTPTFGGVSQLPGDAALTGLRTGEHQGSGANELVFDDTTGEVGLRLGSTTAGTELNLGHIATPRQDGKASPRGTGAELRTDGAAVVRAAQGMLLTTQAVSKAVPHIQRDDLTDLLARCHELTRALGEVVARAGGNAPTLDGQGGVKDALASWSRSPASGTGADAPLSSVLAIHGREGIVAATPASQVMYAGRHVDVAADGNVHIASGEYTHLSAAQGATIHACNGGVDIGADHGPVRLRADQAEALIDARDAIRLTSHNGDIVLSARNIRLVAEDGSFLRLGGGIEMGTSQAFRIYAEAPIVEGPKTMPHDAKESSGENTRQRVQVRYHDIDRAARRAAINRPYEATLPDGSSINQRTGADGMTDWMKSATADTAKVRLHLDEGAPGDPPMGGEDA